MIAYILIIIGGLTLTVGDVFMQKWVDTNITKNFIIGMIIYVVALTCLAFSFKYKNIVIASVLYILINIISLLIVNYYLFNQPLSSSQFIGIFFAIVSIIFLEIKF